MDEILDGLWISTDIAFFKAKPFLRKVAFGPSARWSARLGKQNDWFCHLCKLEAPVPVGAAIILFHHDFETDFGRLLQHGFHGAVLLHRQTNRIFYRFSVHFAGDAVNQFDLGVDLRRL